MADEPKRCPSCGAERPTDAPQGLCPRCLALQARAADTPARHEPDAATGPATTAPDRSHEPKPVDSGTIGAFAPGSSSADRTIDHTIRTEVLPREDHGELPRQAADRG